MAYFANGSEGDWYEERYCARCIHDGNCTVWDAHMLLNYDECNKPDSILHMLWPREGAHNGDCRMFHEKPAAEHQRNTES